MAPIERVARAIEPGAWAEYDAGNGTCTNQAGWKVKDSLEAARRLLAAFPGLEALASL